MLLAHRKNPLWLIICFVLILPSACKAEPTEDHFQTAYGSFWKSPVPTSATFIPLHFEPNGTPGLYAQYYRIDINRRVVVDNTMPEVALIVPGGWTNRSRGKTVQGKVRLPNELVVADVVPSNTPNNPTAIYNTSTKKTLLLNAVARPQAGGPIYGYNGAGTHAGSGLSGGEITLEYLSKGIIPHALAINLWGRKYLTTQGGGFTAPAWKADSNYTNPSNLNYYGNYNSPLKLGSRLAIPKGVLAKNLGIRSRTGLILFNAMKKYGVYVVDNSGWDCLYLHTTPDAAPYLQQQEADIQKLFSVLQLVQP